MDVWADQLSLYIYLDMCTWVLYKQCILPLTANALIATGAFSQNPQKFFIFISFWELHIRYSWLRISCFVYCFKLNWWNSTYTSYSVSWYNAVSHDLIQWKLVKEKHNRYIITNHLSWFTATHQSLNLQVFFTVVTFKLTARLPDFS